MGSPEPAGTCTEPGNLNVPVVLASAVKAGQESGPRRMHALYFSQVA